MIPFVWRKIQKLGLAATYKDENLDGGKCLHYCFGLTYLRLEEVEDAFYDLICIHPADTKLASFADYLTETYIDKMEQATFPSRIWTADSSDLWRTTNAFENFHSRFNSSCASPHPNIFRKVIIDELKFNNCSPSPLEDLVQFNDVAVCTTDDGDLLISGSVRNEITLTTPIKNRLYLVHHRITPRIKKHKTRLELQSISWPPLQEQWRLVAKIDGNRGSCSSAVSIHEPPMCRSNPSVNHSAVTALVEAQDVSGSYQVIRVLLDSGSQASFITVQYLSRPGLSRRKASLDPYGLSHTLLSVAKVPLYHLQRGLMFQILKLAEPTWCTLVPIDMMIGAETFSHIITGRKLKGESGNPCFLETVFDWVLTGRLQQPLMSPYTSSLDMSSFFIYSSSCTPTITDVVE
uniref:(California timema) hypothetical protein n=1 Tax=Timema californicum TaxID=61474 RepID=A0A7R9P9Z3_TIMCA|nr:unnamed protein product [Timema californicum]